MTSQFQLDTNRHRERGTKASINLDNISHNLDVFKKIHPGKIIAVVKADAYGHGLKRAVFALEKADAFAVATIEEAQYLRALNASKRIILLEGIFNAEELAVALALKLDVVIHQNYQIELLKSMHIESTLDVWLKIDTGMGRLGFDVSELDKKLQSVKELESVNTIRLMSHYASSDKPESEQTQSQLNHNQILKSKGYEYSFSNTGAVLNQLADAEEWVRVGLGLYGISPLDEPHWAESFGLLPAMHLTAKIIATKRIKKGSKVGYNGQFTASKDMRIGIVGIGYADGYPWSNSNSVVMLDKQRIDVLGRVSMDMIAIDVSDFNQALTGIEVTIWGNQLPIEQVASDLKLIPYALVCGITSRVEFYDNQ